MVPGLKQTVYKVSKSLWTLFDGLSTATLTLIDVAPSVPFRCAVTLAAATGHTDCLGTVTIGSETLTFTGAGKKLSKTNLSALPVITTSGLDCSILITCISALGADIEKEILSTIKCAWVPSQKYFQNSLGEWQLSDIVALTKTSLNADDIISYNNFDYIIKQVLGGNRIMGITAPYKLFLTGGSPSPSGRLISTEDAISADIMMKGIYDVDKDGIVDKAESIPVLAAIPTDLSGFADGDMFKVGNKTYIVNDEV